MGGYGPYVKFDIMGQDDTHGKRLEYNGKKDAHVHQGARDAPMGKRIDTLDLVGAVQQHDLKGLVQCDRITVPVREQEFCHFFGICDRERFQGPQLFPVTYLYFIDFVFHVLDLRS
tara:strand:- start:1471 stop:1818 length:348 start_codon:yes stop_codon:yes gene_type:complete